MNDAQTPQGTAAPAAPQHASAAAIAAGANAPTAQATPPAEPQKPTPNGAGDTPAWLPERLEQAKRTAQADLLKALGVEKPEDLKAQLQELAELKKASMTEAEKRQAELEELKPKAAKAAHYEQLFGNLIATQFDALPETTRTAIDQMAQGNAEQRWQIMQVMQAAGNLVPPAPVKPTPASTTPQGAPPPPASPATPKTAFQTWQEMKATDSMRASLYFNSNRHAIEASRQT